MQVNTHGIKGVCRVEEKTGHGWATRSFQSNVLMAPTLRNNQMKLPGKVCLSILIAVLMVDQNCFIRIDTLHSRLDPE